ncbi:protein transport protein S31 [Elasticomyces elasticus]|nr:protein transport protein S31 [Elasticomyces elasticus]
MPDSRPSTAQSQRASTSTPAAVKYPTGDRAHIPSHAQPVFDLLSADMARVKSKAPVSFKPQVNDTDKRLNILFDHLNNEDLLKDDTIGQLLQIAQCIKGRQFDQAQQTFVEMQTAKGETEGGVWMVGVKRLIAMSKVTPA